jgi:hypothetical protein
MAAGPRERVHRIRPTGPLARRPTCEYVLLSARGDIGRAQFTASLEACWRSQGSGAVSFRGCGCAGRSARIRRKAASPTWHASGWTSYARNLAARASAYVHTVPAAAAWDSARSSSPVRNRDVGVQQSLPVAFTGHTDWPGRGRLRRPGRCGTPQCWWRPHRGTGTAAGAALMFGFRPGAGWPLCARPAGAHRRARWLSGPAWPASVLARPGPRRRRRIRSPPGGHAG